MNIARGSFQPNRREFFKNSAVITGVLLLPKTPLEVPHTQFHFVHTNTLETWGVNDPVQWSLDHKCKPILERAREGLLNLNAKDADRIIRLVVRRCGLILIETDSKRVKVHHWGQAVCDLRPFFKKNRLTSADIQVSFVNRKTEQAKLTTGDEFLYGTRMDPGFPFELFAEKWSCRKMMEPGDNDEAPVVEAEITGHTLCVGPISWSALKCVWQRNPPAVCPNCDQPSSIVASYRRRPYGLGKFSRNITSLCPKCQRSFVEQVPSIKHWIQANLSEQYWPRFLRFSGRSK